MGDTVIVSTAGGDTLIVRLDLALARSRLIAAIYENDPSTTIEIKIPVDLTRAAAKYLDNHLNQVECELGDVRGDEVFNLWRASCYMQSDGLCQQCCSLVAGWFEDVAPEEYALHWEARGFSGKSPSFK